MSIMVERLWLRVSVWVSIKWLSVSVIEKITFQFRCVCFSVWVIQRNYLVVLCSHKSSQLMLLINVIWELPSITCAEYIHVVSLLTCINIMGACVCARACVCVCVCVCARARVRGYLSFIAIIIIYDDV